MSDSPCGIIGFSRFFNKFVTHNKTFFYNACVPSPTPKTFGADPSQLADFFGSLEMARIRPTLKQSTTFEFDVAFVSGIFESSGVLWYERTIQ